MMLPHAHDELASWLISSGDTAANIQSIAGKFFQVSLLPYLVFLYFLTYKGNRTPATAIFGFQYLLVFVAAGIFGGVLTESTYGCILANADWIHGGSEALLTLSNVLIVFGFRNASIYKAPPAYENKLRTAAWAAAGLFAASVIAGSLLSLPAHAPFLLGLGNLPQSTVESLPWLAHTEPANALSLSTWLIHFSSVYEFLIAMDMIWKFSEITENESWKGLTWGMLPLHAGSIMACTFHFHYNDEKLQFLILLQGVLTLLGNSTIAYASYRIAQSNGWMPDNLLDLFPMSNTSFRAIQGEVAAMKPLVTRKPNDTELSLSLKIVGLTVLSSYIAKYGSLGVELSRSPNPFIALAVVLGIPTMTAAFYYNRAKEEGRY
jgi:hypothetical protein